MFNFDGIDANQTIGAVSEQIKAQLLYVQYVNKLTILQCCKTF